MQNFWQKIVCIFFIFFYKKASNFEEILHIKYEKAIIQIAKNILYKLHNEVFAASEIRLNTECSLISSEGISVYQHIRF